MLVGTRFTVQNAACPAGNTDPELFLFSQKQNKDIHINDRVQIIGNHSFLQVRASSSAGIGPWSKQVLLGRYTLDTGGQQPSVSYFVLGFKNAFIHSSAN